MLFNEIENLWPIHLGTFENKDHLSIKSGLLTFFDEYEKENPLGRQGAENSNLFESSYDIHLKKNFLFPQVF